MKGVIALFCLLYSCVSFAQDSSFVGNNTDVEKQVAEFQFANDDRRLRAIALSKELRCPQCQNQNLLESNSPIALDLRLEVYKMVEQGKTDQEVKSSLVDRFGEFVLYHPNVSSSSLVLWLLPLLFVLGFVWYLRKKLISSR
ncbi:cytochrome c-type biogenesis protein CcmH [Vibrio sp. SCSIO 43136]|uniref:cytochrome c-type biogenesis protein CcmH n=1 Tax=Vibrio sp. SCSIO 43136 TaxID=2819101 RepID=UPI0020750ABC|nr:cytochrome c-type biogenesis protein CcmH [Vibrio sp. SCSIO 43136]USD66387.1 cytochrome c-type biogenesis protein CcmH [Vibrio sp. SCSIO 43136]